MPGTESHLIRAKGSIHQEDITILKLDGPNNKASKCMTNKQTKSPSAHGRPAPPEPREAWTQGAPSAVPRPRMVLDVLRCVLVFSQPWFSGQGRVTAAQEQGTAPASLTSTPAVHLVPDPTAAWGVGSPTPGIPRCSPHFCRAHSPPPASAQMPLSQ